MKTEETTKIEMNLFERLCDIDQLRLGFRAVKCNRGAPGIDGVSVKDFAENLTKEVEQLSNELKSWSYKPAPVRKVTIPKPDGGERYLGIPNVRDRVVQTTLKMLIEPIFEPNFSDGSYGFRPGKGQQQAVAAAKAAAEEGKDHVVDIDLEKFFDRIHHDRLIGRLGKEIKDKRILRLIGETLRSGIMDQGIATFSEEGVPQGSPLSPLLSNVVLDELDKELEKRGLTFARFADDCNIFVSSMKAAERVMKGITEFIEKRLKLKVNQTKSQVAKSEFVKFLGMTVKDCKLMISEKSIRRAFDKVVTLVRTRRSHLDMKHQIKKVNQWYIGWSNYYQMTQYPSQLKSIEAHIRRRFRAQLVDHSKYRRGLLYRQLKARGVRPSLAWKTVNANKRRWALSHSRAIEIAYPNSYFMDRLSLKTASHKELPHWFSLDTLPKFS